jgi:hypothetical protein
MLVQQHHKAQTHIIGVVEMEFGMTGLLYFARVEGRMKWLMNSLDENGKARTGTVVRYPTSIRDLTDHY